MQSGFVELFAEKCEVIRAGSLSNAKGGGPTRHSNSAQCSRLS